MTEDDLQVAVAFTIFGQPYSKANSRQRVWNKRYGRWEFIKSDHALAYVQAVKLQSPLNILEGELRITITAYYPNERSDLDVSLILDALQGRVYKNDRQCREQHLYHAIDKQNPRAEIQVEPR